MDMKLEVAVVPVSDVERANGFCAMPAIYGSAADLAAPCAAMASSWPSGSGLPRPDATARTTSCSSTTTPSFVVTACS